MDTPPNPMLQPTGRPAFSVAERRACRRTATGAHRLPAEASAQAAVGGRAAKAPARLVSVNTPDVMTARKHLTLLLLMTLLFTASSCDDKGSTKRTDVVTRLCRQIARKRQKMIVDTNQTEIVWSDGAILEFGTNFPTALQELISRPTRYQDIHSFVKELDARKASEW